MIPLVDVVQVLADLEEWGWRPGKIDNVCGFSLGYVAQIKCGNVRVLGHERAVRLYNFWEQEAHQRGAVIAPYASPTFHVDQARLQTQDLSVTT